MSINGWPDTDGRHVALPCTNGRDCILCRRPLADPYHISEEMYSKLTASYLRIGGFPLPREVSK